MRPAKASNKGMRLNLPWSVRGRVHLGQLPDASLSTLKRLSTDDLTSWTAGWRQGTDLRMRGEMELRRREGFTARLALVIAFLSLMVSIANAAIKAS